MRRDGFTLKGFIIIMGIIAVFAVFLFPLYASYFGFHICKARPIACMNNLKQIGIAIQLYQSDWNGSFPSATATKYGNHWRWMNQLSKYVKAGSKVYICPAADHHRHTGVKDPERIVDYGMNEYLRYPGRLGKPYRTMKSLPNPTKTALIAESAVEGLFNDRADRNEWKDGLALGVNRIRYANTPDMLVNWPPKYTKRHENGTFIVFADGHAGYVAFDKFVCSNGKQWPLINPDATPAGDH